MSHVIEIPCPWCGQPIPTPIEVSRSRGVQRRLASPVTVVAVRMATQIHLCSNIEGEAKCE